ncbi:MAG: DUF1684 domain-containing protein [Beijerinckiaceae bacterium]|nr:DUF1684 domain-containing protein [Beijerinckiaceae bacterium]
METNYLDLLDYRRQTLEMYRILREIAEADPAKAWLYWRQRRDQLFATHPQTALSRDVVSIFQGLSYFRYDPALRFRAPLDRSSRSSPESIGTSTGAARDFFRIGTVSLPVGTLEVYWLNEYSGGLFLPFQDPTGAYATYGGGRYVLDTAKGADLGSTTKDELIIDFNFAYNPSCHYDPQWNCPLSPSANRLAVRIEAGEMRFDPSAERLAGEAEELAIR